MTRPPGSAPAAGAAGAAARRCRRRHRPSTGWRHLRRHHRSPCWHRRRPPPARCAGSASDACCCAWLAARGLGLGAGLGCRGFGLHPLEGLAGPALLLLADQLAELGFGVGLGLLQLFGLRLGRLLGVGDLLGLVGGRLALLLERLLLLGQLGDGLLEIVGVGGAAVEGDPGQLVALQLLAELRRLAEDPHPVGAGLDERLHGDVAQLGLQLGDLGLLLGDGLLGGGDVVFELVQLVEGDVVLLGELGGLLLQRLDHVGVLLDLAALVVDRIGGGDAGAGERCDEDGDSGHDEAGDTRAERSHDGPHPSQTLRTDCNHVATDVEL